MAVREFDGVGDMITCSAGGITGDLQLAHLSFLVIAKPITTGVAGRPFVTTGIVGTADVNGFYDNGAGPGELGLGGDGGDAYSGGGVTGFTTGVWQVLGVTRPSGAAPTPRFHRKALGSGSWYHGNATGTHNMTATSPTAVRFGKWCNSAMDANMRLALVAIWKGTLLSDADYATIEAAATTAAILALSPTGLWEFNQTSTGTSVTDLVGSANETSLVGTSVVTTDDPAWTFGAATGAAALDVANVGQGSSASGSGTLGSVSLTTAAAVAPGARIFLGVCIYPGGVNPAFTSVSPAGGLTWTLEGQAGAGTSGDSTTVMLLYADAPAGLASGTTLTVNWTGGGWEAGIVASSYIGLGGTRTAEMSDRTLSTTAWTTGSVSVGAGGMLIAVCGNGGAGGGNSNTPTSPCVEDQDYSPTRAYVTLVRRIESSAGSVAVAGTLATAPNVRTAIVGASYPYVAPAAPATPVTRTIALV